MAYIKSYYPIQKLYSYAKIRKVFQICKNIFARGEQTSESDVDILVVLDNNDNIGLKFFGMYEDLKEILGRNVDLVTEDSLAQFARQSVNRDKKLMREPILEENVLRR
ncbi:MAG: nucleotidyltransferase domain-containing protein [Bacteroidales bacterium]|nr:nucleotidyltransferase domain-containing protein [Bacteroidales bacterium]